MDFDFRDWVIMGLGVIIIVAVLTGHAALEECKHTNNVFKCELIAVPVEVEE